MSLNCTDILKRICEEDRKSKLRQEKLQSLFKTIVMVEKKRLYDAFGEMIYVLAMADGKVQVEEMDALEAELMKHPWAEEIEWSFNYERKRGNDVKEVYKKAMQTFVDYGPAQEYKRLLEIMEYVAAASNKIDPQELEMILSFQYDFKVQLKKDLQSRRLISEDDYDVISKRVIQQANTVVGVPRERLYSAFGEIVYLVAKADGIIEPSEIEKVKEQVKNHELGKELLWSFNYEMKKQNDPAEVYDKAIQVLQDNGPDPDYDLLIDLLEKISVSSDGMDESEANFIMDMEADLRSKIVEDLSRINDK